MSIKVRNITHIYSEGQPHQSVAIEDVSFDIEDGQLVGIIGHTGSGKSTLVQHLNGLLKPKCGQIVIDGVDITAGKASMVQIRKQVGLVFQYPEYQLFEETVEKDIAFGPKNLGLSDEEIDKAVKKSLALVNLDYETIKDKSPFELSGGQKRRVAIAGVIAMEPKVLILDEPTAGLDPKAHNDILEMIREIGRTEDTIIVLVSHNMNDIANMADKVLVMEKGLLVMDGSPSQVFARRDELTAMGLDLPQVSNLAADLKAKGFNLSGNIFNMDQMEEELLKVLDIKP